MHSNQRRIVARRLSGGFGSGGISRSVVKLGREVLGRRGRQRIGCFCRTRRLVGHQGRRERHNSVGHEILGIFPNVAVLDGSSWPNETRPLFERCFFFSLRRAKILHIIDLKTAARPQRFF